MKILLVDDHVLFREGLTGLINSQPDLSVVGAADSVQEAIVKASALKPDIILMDFGLPDGTGLDATIAILDESPDTKIVFLTMHEDDDRLFKALRSGAKGYLLKNTSVNKLLSFIRGVQQGKAAITRATAGSCSHTCKPGTDVSIPVCGPRIPSGACGLRSYMSMWLGPPN